MRAHLGEYLARELVRLQQGGSGEEERAGVKWDVYISYLIHTYIHIHNICLSVCLPIYLSIYPCLPIYLLSTYLPIDMHDTHIILREGGREEEE
jgi:hypothetical protein